MLSDFLYIHYQDDDREYRFPPYFPLTQRWLKVAYPDANFHLATNVRQPCPGFIHHRMDLRTSLLSKLIIFDLLDAPFLYLDQDVIVQKPIDEQILRPRHGFQFFTDVKRVLYKDLFESCFDTHYNSGVVYVDGRSEDVYEDMLAISATHPAVRIDDVVMSYYCFQHSIRFDNIDGVNQPVYGEHSAPADAQSLHFIGKDKTMLMEWMRDRLF